MIGRCAIYADRPEHCRTFPTAVDLVPPRCTYTFDGCKRSGTCRPEVCGEGICCAYPRHEGKPLGPPAAPPVGKPCEHLTWT